MCLLHTNELPLRHVFAALDGGNKWSDTFAGPIGKKIQGPVSSWPVTQFKGGESSTQFRWFTIAKIEI